MDEEINNDTFNLDAELNKASSKEELGFTDYVADGLMGVPRGIENAAQDVYGLADGATQWVGQKITGDEEFDFLPDWTENWTGEAKTGLGSAIESVTEFATMFIPGQGIASAMAKGTSTVNKVAKLAKLGKASEVAGAVASKWGIGTGMAVDAIITKEGDQNLSNLAKEFGFDNAVTDFLATEEDDSLAETKFKAMLEGAVLGGGMEVVGRKLIAPIFKSFKRKKAWEKAINEGLPEKELKQVMEDHKFTDGEIDVLKKAQEGFKKIDEKAVTLLAKSPDLKKAKDIFTDMNYSIRSNDILAIAKQNYKNVVTVNSKLEKTFAIAKSMDDIDRDTVVKVLKELADLKEVTSLQGKSLQALKGQAAAKKGIAQESSELARIKQTAKDAKKLSAPELEKLKNVIATTQTMSELRKILSTTMSQVPVQAHAKLGYLLQESWKNGLLSGTGTWALNAVGNSFTMLHQPFKRILQSTLKGDTIGIRSGLREYRSMLSHSMTSSKFALKSFTKNFKTSNVGGIMDSSSSAFIDTASKGKFVRKWSKDYVGHNAYGTAAEYIGTVVNLPLTLIGSMDEGFKQLAVRSRLEGQLFEQASRAGLEGNVLESFIQKNMKAAIRESGELIDKNVLFREGLDGAKKAGVQSTKDRLAFANNFVKENTDDALEGMKGDLIDHARKVTFQQDLPSEGISGGLANYINKHQLLFGWALPFVKTPTNVLKYGYDELLPFKAVMDGLSNELHHSDINIKAEAQARFATSVTVLGTALGFANLGVITGGGPQNPGQRANLMATGWQPYSIKIGDRYFSYNRLDPVALPVGMIADTVERYNSGDVQGEDGEKLVNSMTIALMSNFKSKSYLQGLVNLMSIVSNASEGKDNAYLASQFVGSFVPSMVNQVNVLATNDDPMVKARGYFDSMMERVGFDSTLEIKRNLLGEEQREQDTGNLWLSKILPSKAGKAKKDKVLDAIAASGTRKQDFDYEVDGVDLREIKMEDGRSAYSHYLDLIRDVKVNGKNLRKHMEALVSSKAFNKAPEDMGTADVKSLRAEYIENIISIHRRKAKQVLLNTNKEFADRAQLRKDIRHQVRTGRQSTQEAINALLNPVVET